MQPRIEPYRFTAGGPLRRLEEWLRITRHEPSDWLRRAAAAIVIGYLPELVLGVIWRAGGGAWPELLLRWSTHVRWLLAAPLLFAAEQLTDQRVRYALAYVRDAEVLPLEQFARYRHVLAWADRLREAPLPELVLLLLALGSALTAGLDRYTLAPPRWWSGLLGLALFRFLLLRWLWRWLIWALFLRRFARLPLRLSALHPDGLGGLGPLLGPSYTFCVTIAAGAIAMAAGFADLMLRTGARTQEFHAVVLTYAGLTYVIADAPLWAFAGLLYGARKDGLRRYGAFATRYCSAFEQVWFESSGRRALGIPALQSLADLGSSYAVAARIQVLPLSRLLALGVAAATVVPMLPLVLTEVRFIDLVKLALRAMTL